MGWLPADLGNASRSLLRPTGAHPWSSTTTFQPRAVVGQWVSGVHAAFRHVVLGTLQPGGLSPVSLSGACFSWDGQRLAPLYVPCVAPTNSPRTIGGFFYGSSNYWVGIKCC